MALSREKTKQVATLFNILATYDHGIRLKYFMPVIFYLNNWSIHHPYRSDWIIGWTSTSNCKLVTNEFTILISVPNWHWKFNR